MADIDIARGDYAVEGRYDALERLELLQPVHIRCCGVHLSGRRLQLRDGVVRVLLRDRVIADQILVAIGSCLRQRCVALSRCQVRFCLCQLLIQLRRLDDCKQLALAHMRADVVVPGLHVAGRSRVDRGKGECLHVAWQHDLLCALLQHRLLHGHGRGRDCIGILREHCTGVLAPNDSDDSEDDRYNEDDDNRRQHGPARDLWRRLMLR